MSSLWRSYFLKTAVPRPRIRVFARPWVLLAVRRYNTESGKVSEPLRILFCGSDEFSCKSLHSLYQEHLRNAELVKSIDVVVRPSKRVGRGRKELKEVPLKSLAESFKLPIHERDTFTGWSMPSPDGEPINLIIAVSFGLFVPPRLLRAAQYGGLNVHPSLLPDLRGPAPLHHALLQRRTHTGITLQTLSEVTFDAGVVLAQTPWPGTPIPPDTTVLDLYEKLAPLGAEMLVRGLRTGVHVPPHISVGWQPSAEQSTELRHAPKLGPNDRQVRWVGKDAWGASGTVLRTRVTRPLWTRVLGMDGEEKRIHLDGGLDVVPRESWPQDMKKFMHVVGRRAKAKVSDGETKTQDRQADMEELRDAGISNVQAVTWIQEDDLRAEDGAKSTTKRDVLLPYFVDRQSIIVPTVHGDCLRIESIKVEGDKSKPASVAIRAFSEDYMGRRDGDDTWAVGNLIDSMAVFNVLNPIAWLEDL